MRSKFVFCLFVVLPLLVSGCDQRAPSSSSGESTLQRIIKEKRVKVGYIVFPPIVTKNLNNGNLGGHFVDTVREIARRADWDVEFVETDWSGFAAGLESKRFDISIAPTFMTIPRLESVSFTDPLLFAGNSAIVRKGDDRFSTILDLNSPDITIALTQGEAGHEFAQRNLPRAKFIVHPGPDQMLTFQDVLTGRADAALGDAYVTAKFAEQHSDKVKDLFGDNPYNLTPVSWAVRYGDNDLLTFLNNSIKILSIQGKLREFESKAGANWLHEKVTWTYD